MNLLHFTHRAGIALDGRPKELGASDQEAAGDEDDGGELVEKLESPVVDTDLVDLKEGAGHLSDCSY